MKVKKLFLFFLILASCFPAIAQENNPEAADEAPAGPWTKTASLGLSYNQNTLTNPPVGYGQNQAGGNAQFRISLNYDKGKIFWPSFLQWNFGLLRIGSGPLQAGSSERIPFQKTLD